ncbi:MAG TPA: ABC transporter permease subunit [Candidatus Saccharimonadales bacterium]|nr:ABC transporter permease subunit [Candidatus Saccharimonadales bacterium]
MIATLVWELRQRRSAIFWWTLGSVVLASVILALYPSIRDQAQQFNKVLNQLPDGIRQLKTGGASTVDVANPVSFLNSQLFYATLPILWIILAITRGSAVLGRDEESHTLELVLARPLSRGRLLLAKGLSLVSEFVVIGSVTVAAVALLAPLFNLHIGTSHLVLATAYTAAFSLSFGLLAFMLQAASSLARRGARAIAVLVGFGGYLLASLSGLTHWLETPAKFAPYHYFAPDKVLQGQPVHGLDTYLIGVVILTAVVSYLGFRRRDIS